MKLPKFSLLVALAPSLACAVTLSLAPLGYTAETTTPLPAVANARAEPKLASVGGDVKGEPQVQAKAELKQKELDQATVKGINRLPGVKMKTEDLTTTPELPPIHGFHPIKKMLRPVVLLEKNSVDLQKQIMRLTGPIAGLQGPMLGLQKKMDHVENRMVGMQGSISGMQGSVTGADTGMKNVSQQMNGVRADLKSMRNDITDLRKPIVDLQQPLHALQGPLGSVAGPLREIHTQLADLKNLLGAVLVSIVIAAMTIAIGTPIAAVLIYRNRRKLFPHMSDHEFPVAKASDKDRLTRV